jgi:hypothetical protein
MAGDPADDEGGRWTKNLGFLDLSGMRSREDAARLRLKNIALVLVPEAIPDLLAGAECKNIGAVVPVATGTRVEQRTGQVELPGEVLAGGDPNTILSVTGQVVVTPPIPSVGYRGLVLVGQVLLPRSSQAALAGKIMHITGQTVYYDDDTEPRVFVGGMRFTQAFLDQFDKPLTLILIGGGRFAADVTPEGLRRAVRAIVVIGGAIVERPELAPVVEFLARTQIGGIHVAGREDEADDEPGDEEGRA